MKHVSKNGFLQSGLLIAGAMLICAGPSLAQRSRPSDDKDKKDDARPASRPESRPETRPAPREERPVYRAPEPFRVQRDTPRFEPAPQRNPAPREMPRIDVPQRTVPVDNGPVFRNSQPERRPNGGGLRSQPVDTGPLSRPRNQDNQPDPGSVRQSPSSERPGSMRRESPRSLPVNPGRSESPIYRGGRGTGTAGNGPITRQPNAPAERNPSGNIRGGGARNGPLMSGNSSSPITWRPPSRAGAERGDNSSMQPGSATRGSNMGRRSLPGGSSPIYRPGSQGIVHNVPVDRGYRPPPIDHNQWNDGGRRYGGRHFFTVDLGGYDPWYSYNTGFYAGSRFYYPYYYCGPYVSGYYYSPFWCYGNWAPVYIYPERVIVIEKRVYLHDVVDDDYDLYNTSAQSSMRDTMEDIKSAWLDADGGRLLQHINQAIPVRINQRGVYKYSLEPDDFRDVTKDALNRVETVGFEWTNVDRVSADEVQLEARHTFKDSDGEKHVIRLTYTLEKAQGGWWITESGSEKWTSDI